MLAGRLAIPRHRPFQRELAGRTDHRDPSLRRSPASVLDRWSVAWSEHAPAYLDRLPDLPAASESDCRRELLFCLLGGHGVSYELALSAADVLLGHGVFGASERRGDRLQRFVHDLLTRPWYEPLKRDGQARRYRYPKRKARLVREADDWLRSEADGELLARLRAIGNQQERREWLVTCPGVGPKTASWVLRNVGLGDGLAILDVHILRALEGAGRVRSYRLPRDYAEVEQAFLRWSSELGAPPGAFDLFLWEHGRGMV